MKCKNLSVVSMSVLSFFFFLAVLLPSSAAAAGPIAVINVQEVMEKSRAARDAQAEWEKEFEKQRDIVQKEQRALEALRQEIEQRSSVWSEQVRSEKEREFQRRVRAFEALNEDAQIAIQQKEQSLMGPIMQKLDEVVAELGKSGGYSLILDYTVKGLATRTGVLYAADSINISEKVGEELDRRLRR